MSFFLYSGQITVFFKAVGKTPFSIARLNMWTSGLTIFSLQDLINRFEISSSPKDFLFGIESIALIISTVVQCP